MSTPERQQDPGENGYRGTKQGTAAPDQQEPVELPPWPLNETHDDDEQEAPAEPQPDEQQAG